MTDATASQVATEVSWRRVAHEHGWELHRSTTDVPDLRCAILAWVGAELERDRDVLTSPVYGWQDFLQRLAHGLRRVAQRCPDVAGVLVSPSPVSTWARAPLHSEVWTRRLLEALTGEGFDDRQAVAAYRAFSTFLLGHLAELLPVAADAAVAGVGVLPGPHDPDVDFEDSLEQLLERLTKLRTEGAASPDRTARRVRGCPISG